MKIEEHIQFMIDSVTSLRGALLDIKTFGYNHKQSGKQLTVGQIAKQNYISLNYPMKEIERLSNYGELREVKL